MRVVYGMDVQDHDDKFVRIAEEASEALGATIIPGRFLVDMVPIRE